MKGPQAQIPLSVPRETNPTLWVILPGWGNNRAWKLILFLHTLRKS
uniref:Uncharacterized protein n=1 Tax=Rhizophora mucronata TaxID=61149 RepID=A0A2P2Q5N4_RHIMU